jgi:hypothetical protein
MTCRLSFDPQGRDVPDARVSMPAVWDATGALAQAEAAVPTFGDQDLRVMARMRHTGVSYGDIAWIFGIPEEEARRLIRAYVRMSLGELSGE